MLDQTIAFFLGALLMASGGYFVLSTVERARQPEYRQPVISEAQWQHARRLGYAEGFENAVKEQRRMQEGKTRHKD